MELDFLFPKFDICGAVPMQKLIDNKLKDRYDTALDKKTIHSFNYKCLFITILILVFYLMS